MTIKKFLFPVVCALMGLIFASCHCNHGPLDAPFKVGHVLCSDGSVISMCDYMNSSAQAVGIVYWVNPDTDADVKGYAVWLSDIEDSSFASDAAKQGTSTDVYALDGNANTYALYSNTNTESEMAKRVFDMWTYGQSAFIPSVAEARLIYQVRDRINPRLEAIGGECIPAESDQCWYWTSTEVAGQEEHKGWLYSFGSGRYQETPKGEKHRVRPVVAIYE